ncbi:splicing factor 3A subunit 2-like [Boleophthalmus pectinirostris]|uniref:splicing factor 3A subunit 2-like n=1 Tax=Boleophthalmus pectinirostris TaxID=150288 RepID=UPI002431C91A|nr:splicing factor 3A subunit 2-like [Boleophthalmus pectinirostris]
MSLRRRESVVSVWTVGDSELHWERVRARARFVFCSFSFRPEGGSDVRDRSKDLLINFKKPRLPKRGLRSKKVPSRGNAPPAANVTTPTSAFTPPTPSLAPPTPSLAPPTPSLPPPTPSLAPPTSSLAPPTSLLAPPSVTIRSQVEVNEEDDRRVNKEPCYSLWSQREREDMELQRSLQDLVR